MCFKRIENKSFHSLFNGDYYVCEKCIEKLKPEFLCFKISKYKGIALYKYDALIKTKIFEYKKCEDYELKDIFISFYINELKIMFKDYVIVPVPSYKEKDEKRGYNHVIEIFKNLNFEIVNCIVKTENIDQKELNFKERQNIYKYMKLNNNYDLRNKRVLLVDDIITTGASMKAVIKLLEETNFKELKILTIAKRVL